MTTPLQHGDPPTLGPFRLTGRMWEGLAGIVYLGTDQDGQYFTVALLNQGAADDIAARDRFRAAISHGRGVDREGAAIAAAEPDGAVPWVATVYDPQQAGAERFLVPVAMTDTASEAIAGAGKGPDFQPHWAGPAKPVAPLTPTPATPPASGGSSHSGLPVLMVVVAVVAVVLGTSGTFLLMARSKPAPDPAPRPSPTLAHSSPAATPTATSVRTSGPEVVGATWQPGDRTHTMRGLDGLGFSFRVPAGWGCMKSDYSTPPGGRWVCIDEEASWKGKEVVGNLVVDVGPCHAPCDAAQRKQQRGRLDVEGKWTQTDDTTAYAEWTGTRKGVKLYNIGTSHFWHKDGSKKLNSQVLVLGEIPVKDKAQLQKAINGIRANTP